MKLINRGISSACIILTFVFVAVSSFKWISDNYDVWFHLRIGKTICETRTIPRLDSFSYTFTGKSVILHGWLSEVFFYKVWQIAGINGLIFFKVFVILSCFLMIFFMAGRDSDPLHCSMAMILAVLSSSWQFLERPQIFSFLFSSLTVLLLYGFERGWNKKRVWTFLLLIQILWSNLHGGCLLGLVITTIYVISKNLSAHFKREPFSAKDNVSWGFFLASLIIASAMNPFGFGTLSSPLKDWHSSVRNSMIAEMMNPISFASIGYMVILEFYAIYSVYLFVSLYLNRNKIHLFYWVLAGTFFLLSLKSVRVIPFFVFCSLPSLLICWTGLPERVSSFPEKYRIHTSIFLLLFLSILIFAFYSNRFYVYQKMTDRFAFGISPYRHPVGAVQFMRENHIGGNGFNTPEEGSYLIWALPETHVFIDGRFDLYGDTFMEMYERSVQDYISWQNMLTYYNVDYVLLPATPHAYAERFAPWFYFHPGWALVYCDESSLLYLRRTKINEQIIRRFQIRNGIQAGKPYAPPYTEIRALPGQLNPPEGMINAAWVCNVTYNGP